MLTSMRNPELWKRIQTMKLDADTGSRPFSIKLAKENRWKLKHAQRVIEEYRRFIYLAMISDTPVTPCIAVDKAWHLHLTYTHHYWEEMCGEVLPRPLHHNPSAGQEDMLRYHDQYQATRYLYAEEFGELPPRDLWPPSRGIQKYEQAEKIHFYSQYGIGAAFVVGIWFSAPVGWAIAILSLLAALYGAYVMRKYRAEFKKNTDPYDLKISIGGGECGAGCGD